MACCRLGKEDGDKLRQNILVHNFIALHLKVPAANVSATKHKKMRVGAKRSEQRRGGRGREKEGKERGGGRAVDKALRPLFRNLVIIPTISSVNRDV